MIKELAFKYKDTICIGRSHGVHAEIMTFGFKLLNWLDDFERAKKTFEEAAEFIKSYAARGDIVITMGAGDVTNISNYLFC